MLYRSEIQTLSQSESPWSDEAQKPGKYSHDATGVSLQEPLERFDFAGNEGKEDVWEGTK